MRSQCCGPTSASSRLRRSSPPLSRARSARSGSAGYRLGNCCASNSAVSSRIAAAVLSLVAVSGCGSEAQATHRGARASGSPSRVVVVPKRAFTIGYSVRHRPIEAVEIGDPRQPRRMLVVGCIHGTEPAGIAVARHLIRLAHPPRTTLWVIPDLNPDGVAADTRQNAEGVDLNRNFPWHWR